jgi:hypothetical protein
MRSSIIRSPNIYYDNDQIRRVRLAEYVARMGNAILWQKNIKGKTPLGRPRHRWEDNIKMGLKDIGCGPDSSGSG